MKSPLILSVLIASSTALMALAQNTTPTHSGLLLGLRQDNTKTGRSSYRTLWIAPSSSKDIGAKLQAQAPDILVARDDGWWRVGVARETIATGGIDVLYTHPVTEGGLKNLSHAAVGNCIEGDYDSNFDYSETILFVGSNYISHQKRATALKPCDRYGTYFALEVNRFDQLKFLAEDHKPFSVNFSPENIKFSEFGQEAQDAHTSAWLDSLNALSSEDQTKLGDQKKPDDDNWGVVRKSGKWVIRAGLNSSLETYFDVQVLPETLEAVVGKTEPEFGNSLTAKDWMYSPNKDLMVQIVGSKLELYKVWGAKPSTGLISSIPLKPNEAVVMVQWAVGKGLERWSREVPKLLK
jgi:hypothetical protein